MIGRHVVWGHFSSGINPLDETACLTEKMVKFTFVSTVLRKDLIKMKKLSVANCLFSLDIQRL